MYILHTNIPFLQPTFSHTIPNVDHTNFEMGEKSRPYFRDGRGHDRIGPLYPPVIKRLAVITSPFDDVISH